MAFLGFWIQHRRDAKYRKSSMLLSVQNEPIFKLEVAIDKATEYLSYLDRVKGYLDAEYHSGTSISEEDLFKIMNSLRRAENAMRTIDGADAVLAEIAELTRIARDASQFINQSVDKAEYAKVKDDFDDRRRRLEDVLVRLENSSRKLKIKAIEGTL